MGALCYFFPCIQVLLFCTTGVWGIYYADFYSLYFRVLLVCTTGVSGHYADFYSLYLRVLLCPTGVSGHYADFFLIRVLLIYIFHVSMVTVGMSTFVL